MSARPLDPDVAEAALYLTRTCRVTAVDDPGRYRAVLRGRRELVEFFRRELGWELDVREVAGLARLHKRRDDAPGDRGPRLVRADRQGGLASAKVLVLVALVCEQLWRRPRITLRELLQAVAQVCAAEAPTGRLPRFRVVASDGVSKREAQQDRQDIVDALKLLVAEGEISVDSDLDLAVADENVDVFIAADRERLSTKFASLSPSLLGLSGRPVDGHIAALSAPSLPDADLATVADRLSSVEGRRLTALRRVVDDPSTDPGDDPGPVGYLMTSAGRERALAVVAALGLVATVRRDWWEIIDPSGAATDFPQGRRTERQAALALLAELPKRPEPATDLLLAEIVAMLERWRAALPRWAASYVGRLPALARAAAAELVVAGLLTVVDEVDRWRPTPGVHLWRVRVRHGQPTGTAPPVPSKSGQRLEQPILGHGEQP
ncbi:DUF2398 family protein [Frankia sp. QA3]|uniref:DUF2398 family protein n=1 Tax=Frankia sp. QA3 TaxID=710111 RepID=UPI000269C223|nr:DUF2398 family protein [Frankia sp. QA3]EIV92599.1 Protein of unknown function (DUF2398) [Frankia sp. QA3]